MNPPKRPPPLRPAPPSAVPPSMAQAALPVAAAVPAASSAPTLLAWALQKKLLVGGVLTAAYVGGLATGGGIVGFGGASPSATSPTSQVFPSEQTDEPPPIVESMPTAPELAPVVPVVVKVSDPRPKTTVANELLAVAPSPAPTVPNFSTIRAASVVPSPLAPPAASTAFATPPPATAQPARRDPFEDLRRRGFVLDLPPRSTGAVGQAASGELGRIAVDRAADCMLALLGADAAFGPSRIVTLDMEPSSGPDRTWTLNYASKSLAGVSAKKPLAVVTLAGATGSLRFTWETVLPSGLSDQVELLRFCVVEATVGNESERCTFIRPIKTLPLALALTPRTTAPKTTLFLTPSPAVTGVQMVEFAGRSQAEVPLAMDAAAAKLSAATPGVEIEFNVAPAPPSTSPLAAPRKGVRVAVGSDPEFPCYLELELCDSEVSGRTGPAIRAAAFFVPATASAGETTKTAVEPLSPDKFKETVARLTKSLHSGETALAGFERTFQVAEQRLLLDDLQQKLKATSTFSSSNTVGPSGMSRFQLEDNIREIQLRLKAAESRMQADARYRLITKNRDSATDLVKRYEALSAALLKFQDETRIDYRVLFNQGGRSLVLYDTQLPAAP